MNQYIPLIILFIGGCVLTIGDVIMKKWVISNNILTFCIGIFIYMVGMILLAYTFKFKNIAVASAIIVIFNVITLSLISWLYFKEGLSTYQSIGIFLSIVSIIFLELG